MKKISRMILVLSCLLMFKSVAVAMICTPRVVLNIDYANDACGSDDVCVNDYPGSLLTNCTGVLSEAQPCVCVYNICCDDTVPRYENAVWGTYFIGGVAFGDEVNNVEAAFSTFKEGNPWPSPISADYRLTSTLEGYVYALSMNAQDTSDIDVVFWRRGGFSRIGSPDGVLTPIEGSGGGGSGGGGGITQEQTQIAVEGGVKDAISDVDAAGPGSVDASDTTAKKVTSDDNDNSALPGEVSKDSITTKVTSFLASNPLVSLVGGSHIHMESPVCTVSGPVLGKTITISFCDLTDILSILGTVVLSIATLYSMFLAFGVSS